MREEIFERYAGGKGAISQNGACMGVLTGDRIYTKRNSRHKYVVIDTVFFKKSSIKDFQQIPLLKKPDSTSRWRLMPRLIK